MPVYKKSSSIFASSEKMDSPLETFLAPASNSEAKKKIMAAFLEAQNITKYQGSPTTFKLFKSFYNDTDTQKDFYTLQEPASVLGKELITEEIWKFKPPFFQPTAKNADLLDLSDKKNSKKSSEFQPLLADDDQKLLFFKKLSDAALSAPTPAKTPPKAPPKYTRQNTALTIPWAKRISNPKNIAFYSSSANPSNGDGRLVLDTAGWIAEAFGQPVKILREYDDITKAVRLDPDLLIIGINVEVGYIRNYERNIMGVSIQNDIPSSCSTPDIVFNGFYLPTIKREVSEAVVVYDITTLPSRIRPQPRLPEAVDNPDLPNTLDAKGAEKKPVILINIRNLSDDNIAKLLKTCQEIKEKFDAQFIILTGPRTFKLTNTLIKSEFASLPGAELHIWADIDENKNPYDEAFSRATHLVTSGTLSTTSDCFGPELPVFYLPEDGYEEDLLRRAFREERMISDRGIDDKFRQHHFANRNLRLFTVEEFEATLKSTPLMPENEWKKLSKRVHMDIITRMPAFDKDCACRKEPTAAPVLGAPAA